MAGDEIRIEPLDTTNYPMWCVKMRLVLIVKKCWAAVERAAPSAGGAAPQTGGGAPVDEAMDQMALALILLNVKDHHLPHLSKLKTAKAVWDELESTYRAKTFSRRLQLKREFNNLKMNTDESLPKFFARTEALWSELSAAGTDIKETDVVWSILAGLPKQYDTTVAILEAADRELTMAETLSKLLNVEQRIVRQEESDTSALYAKEQHKKPFNNNRHDNKYKNVECFYCHKLGHLERDCRTKKKEMALAAGKSGEKPVKALVATHHVVESALAAVEGPIEQYLWALDSGSTCHTICRPAEQCAQAGPRSVRQVR